MKIDSPGRRGCTGFVAQAPAQIHPLEPRLSFRVYNSLQRCCCPRRPNPQMRERNPALPGRSAVYRNRRFRYFQDNMFGFLSARISCAGICLVSHAYYARKVPHPLSLFAPSMSGRDFPSCAPFRQNTTKNDPNYVNRVYCITGSKVNVRKMRAALFRLGKNPSVIHQNVFDKSLRNNG